MLGVRGGGTGCELEVDDVVWLHLSAFAVNGSQLFTCEGCRGNETTVGLHQWAAENGWWLSESHYLELWWVVHVSGYMQS